MIAALAIVSALLANAVPQEASEVAQADAVPVLGSKPFIAYFRPAPAKALSGTAWGAAEVGPRDVRNGLEDVSMTRWDQALGHKAWGLSKATWAISDSPLGPYRDMGLIWSGDEEGRGTMSPRCAFPMVAMPW